VAEAGLKAPGGPVAFVASFRRNHIYGNAVFGLELSRALFDTREPTLGGCVRRAQRRLVRPDGPPDPIRLALNALALADPKKRVPRDKHPGLLVEHVYLYGLLGDPALRLARPALAVERLAVTLAPNRSHWTVEGRVPAMAEGTALVTLEVPRAAVRATLEPVSPQNPAWRAVMKRNYAAANAKVVAQARTHIEKGRFRAVLPAPPGACIIKVFAWNPQRSALGATRVTRTPKEGNPQ